MVAGISKSMQQVSLLRAGDRLTRDEFERRFDATPGLKKAELIEGEVYMPPPVGPSHATSHADLNLCLTSYRIATPGTVSAIGTSIRFDAQNMPQPDLCLVIAPECGGQMKLDNDGYFSGS